MPFTPFHFAPHACMALSVSKKINIIVFVLANVAVDIEPLLVMTYKLNYPIHGAAHTLIGAAIIGFFWGSLAYLFKEQFSKLLKLLKLSWEFTWKQYIISGVFGAWFHILFDAPLYFDIQPFYPIGINPFYGLVSRELMYKFCSFLFIAAVLMYLRQLFKKQSS